jgi:hypothetical protein
LLLAQWIIALYWEKLYVFLNTPASFEVGWVSTGAGGVIVHQPVGPTIHGLEKLVETGHNGKLIRA